MTDVGNVFGQIVSPIFLVCVGVSIIVVAVGFSIWFLLCHGADEDKGWKVATVPKIIFIIAFSSVE